jgi:bifunctional DNA-binding transcriptional regulator/antitoxin component of YhaV-PrlF toxin-antitoxin module
MAIVEVGSKYRVTIARNVRRKTPLKVGQKVYLLARPPYIVLIPIPENVDEALAGLLGDITFGREERERAEGQLFEGSLLNE